MTDRDRRIMMARFYWDGFYRCPTTGRVLERIHGDDKVLCGCGRSNPRVPQERTEQTGVHIVRFLDPATVEEYVDQEDARRAVLADDMVSHDALTLDELDDEPS